MYDGRKEIFFTAFSGCPANYRAYCEKNLIDEEKATELLYTSELYAQLEDEKTKLWHLSPLALFEMLCEERETGKITYPEEA